MCLLLLMSGSARTARIFWGFAPMIDLSTFEFKGLNIRKIIPNEYFMNAHVEE